MDDLVLILIILLLFGTLIVFTIKSIRWGGMGWVSSEGDPEKRGYYLTKTAEGKWGIAYWDGKKFWDDPAQNRKLSFGIKREFIHKWYKLPK